MKEDDLAIVDRGRSGWERADLRVSLSKRSWLPVPP
jgi:hypothetical protein